LEAGVTSESHTFAVLRDIANSINHSLQLTVYVLGNHPDSRMPVLDLKMRVTLNTNGVLMVCHTF
jgi:hypothetical protein